MCFPSALGPPSAPHHEIDLVTLRHRDSPQKFLIAPALGQLINDLNSSSSSDRGSALSRPPSTTSPVSLIMARRLLSIGTPYSTAAVRGLAALSDEGFGELDGNARDARRG